MKIYCSKMRDNQGYEIFDTITGKDLWLRVYWYKYGMQDKSNCMSAYLRILSKDNKDTYSYNIISYNEVDSGYTYFNTLEEAIRVINKVHKGNLFKYFRLYHRPFEIITTEDILDMIKVSNKL